MDGNTLLSLLETLLLVTAVSADAFAASFAYGAGGIRIPPASVAVISAVGSGMLTLSLFLGGVIRPWLPPGLTTALCVGILAALGGIKLCDSALKAFIRKHTTLRREVRFSFLHLQFILNIYANPEEADSDRSKTLSPLESVPLAAALSLDGLAVGFGAGLEQIHYMAAALMSLAVGVAAVGLGALLGRRAARRLPHDLSWAGGAMLIVLALLKLR